MASVVLFDLDGTLVDTRALYAEAYMRAFEEVLGEMPSWEEFLRRGPSSERHFLLEWYGVNTGGRIHDRMVEVYAERAAALHGPLFAGIEAVIATIRGAGFATGIVTGKSRRGYEVSRELVDLSGYGVVVVEDDVPAPKPDPRGIVRALEALGASASDAVYVGDTPMDIKAARRAGVRPAAALWSRPPEDRARLVPKLGKGVWALEEPAALLARLELA